MGPMKLAVLFIIILASLPLTSLAAGRQRMFLGKYAAPVGTTIKEPPNSELHQEQVLILHSRILKVNTNDYGRYDPSPSLSKPPFKLIPN